MALAQSVQPLTEAEYLESERRSEFKSEFHDGDVFAMSGGSVPHSLIAANVISELRQRLKGSACRVFTSDLRIKVEATGLLTYPDASVICGAARTTDGHRDTAVNPSLVVEVLSPSSEGYDRGVKFHHYRQIPSLREYLLVSQTEPRVDQLVRQEGGAWLLNTIAGLDAEFSLPSLGVKLPLSEIFLNVEFPQPSLHPTAPPRTEQAG